LALPQDSQGVKVTVTPAFALPLRSTTLTPIGFGTAVETRAAWPCVPATAVAFVAAAAVAIDSKVA
jgi:hypothetical protein